MLPISRSTLSEKASGAIKDFILQRRLKPGDKLPSERELSHLLGVSRIVTREALRSLSMAGVVNIYHGKGTFIRSFSGDSIAEQLVFGLSNERSVFSEMLELRIIIECGAIELAVERASEDKRATLRSIVREMRQVANEGHPTEELDLAFHRTLLESTENTALVRLGDVIQAFFTMVSQSFAPSISYQTPDQQAREHEAILVAIEQGDAEEAKRALREALLDYKTVALRLNGTNAKGGAQTK